MVLLVAALMWRPFLSRKGGRDMTTTEQHETEGQGQEARQQERLLEALEDYRRGVADAPCVFKWSVMGAVAAAEADQKGADWQGKDFGGEEASMTFVASTEEVGPPRGCGVGGRLEAGCLPQEPGVPVGPRLRASGDRTLHAGVDNAKRDGGNGGARQGEDRPC